MQNVFIKFAFQHYHSPTGVKHNGNMTKKADWTSMSQYST